MIDFNNSPSVKKILALEHFGIKLGLQNITALLERLGNPQKSFQSFHIAGSNGKGSTSAYLASILTTAGFKTGLYTSPHFVRFSERIRINGTMIPVDYIDQFTKDHYDYIVENSMTFFEVTTALAFQYFADSKIDYAVIETGLGGRLDATVLIHPVASIITTISLEHTNILGNTIRDIAFEKGGIIKPGGKLFIGFVPDAAKVVLTDIALERNSETYLLEDFSTVRGNSFELFTKKFYISDVNSPLKGQYQKANAALAMLSAALTLDISDTRILESGVRSTIGNTGFEGRYEFLHASPAILADAAHNSESIENFIVEFRKEQGFSRRILLFSALKDKSYQKELQFLLPCFDEVYLYQLVSERAADVHNIHDIIKAEGKPATIIENTEAFIADYLNQSDHESCLVVTGSMYLVGEIKAILEKFQTVNK